MNMPLRLAALVLALSLSLGTAVLAQPTVDHGTYRGLSMVDSFGVKQLPALQPGSELAFSLSGTPGASITLHIAGATGEVPMTERLPGSYSGDYTVRLRDRLGAASLVTAQITKDGQTHSMAMDQSLVLGARSPAPAAAARIARFTVTAPERARPGDELHFMLTGAPAGAARVAVQGVSAITALTEVQRGVYEGRYTLRRGDAVQRNLVATGYLVVNRQESSQRFDSRLVDGGNAIRADGRPADERQGRAHCAECGVVESVSLVEVDGDKPNLLGTIAGGVLGGVIGHQVGGGSGKDLATIAGAVGGAYVGNRAENRLDKTQVHRVLVRMDSGATRSIDYAADPGLPVGVAVKFDNGAIVRP